MWNLETNTMGMVIFGRSSYLAASATRLHYDRLWIFGIWRWKRNPFLTPYTGREGERASLSDRVMCVCVHLHLQLNGCINCWKYFFAG
jgi:hypothetical protein